MANNVALNIVMLRFICYNVITNLVIRRIDMADIPEWAKKQRLKNTEIKKIGNQYYLQKVSSKWDKEKKRSQKVSGEYLGVLTPEGLIPAKKRKVSVDVKYYSKEYGANMVIRSLTTDIYDMLKKYFPDLADWIYVTCVLRTMHPAASCYLEEQYEKSYLSEVFTDIPMSSSTISRNMKTIGYRRKEIVDFMKEFMPKEDGLIVFDGTSIVSNSDQIHAAQRGYNSHRCFDPQVNLMYAISRVKEKLMPVFYKHYPGSIRDVTAFTNLLNEMEAESAIIIGDKGFNSQINIEEIESNNLKYIIPLRRNSTEYSREPLKFADHSGFDGHFEYNDRIIWHHSQKSVDGKYQICVYLDETLRFTESNRYRKTVNKGSDDSVTLEGFYQKQLEFGTFVIKTNITDESSTEIYKYYKLREDVEQLFDLYKCSEDNETSGMQSDETLEAWLFLNHISTLMCYRIYNLLRKNGSLKKYATVGILKEYLSNIRVTNIGNGWNLEPLTKGEKQALNALGVSDNISPIR